MEPARFLMLLLSKGWSCFRGGVSDGCETVSAPGLKRTSAEIIRGEAWVAVPMNKLGCVSDGRKAFERPGAPVATNKERRPSEVRERRGRETVSAQGKRAPKSSEEKRGAPRSPKEECEGRQ